MGKENYNNFFDKVHCVYVYKIDAFKTCYVGRTKELRRRHQSHCRGRKHKNGTITFDCIYSFCYEKQIEIPEPIILCKNLTGEESLIKEDFWVNFFRNNGWNVLNKAKTGIKSGSLGHVKVWDYDSCKIESKKYRTRSEFKKGSYGAYDMCRKNGWLDEFIKKDGKHRNGFWKIKNNVIDEAKKYDQITDFIRCSGGAYNAAKKYGWEKDIRNIFFKQISDNEVCSEYLQVGNIKDVMIKFKIGYKKAKQILEEHNIKLDGRTRKKTY